MENKKDKRYISNARVKRSICDALFLLMREKDFSQITITELIETAGVARASFYRNFESKESIILFYLDQLHEESTALIPHEEDAPVYITYEHLVTRFEFLLKNKHALVCIYQHGFAPLFETLVNEYASYILGNMPVSSIERYRIPFIAGAVFHTMMEWLISDAKESPSEMAHFFLKYINKLI